MLEYPSAGIVAAMGPNPCGTLNGLLAVVQRILGKIYIDGERTLGNAFHEAKCEVIQQYFPTEYMYGPAYVYTLLADPALRIKYPAFSVEEISADRPGHTVFQPICSSLIVPLSGRITVYSVLGEVVIDETYVTAGQHISLQGGVYFVNIETENDVTTEKVIIQR
jgi:hypothetical protein